MTDFLTKVQNTIDYKFNNTDLLQQAFVRRSYSEENGGQNNEVLEFIGDKALDLAVIRIMMERFGEITEEKDYQEFKLLNPKYFKTKLKEGQFTDIKKDLVQKKALAMSMEDLGFHHELIMGRGDEMSNVEEQDSVKEDLFEAIIGAVALDSDWDMDEITDVVENMIDFDAYFEREEHGNFVGMVQEWAQHSTCGLPTYEYDETYDGFNCLLTIADERFTICQERGEGTSLAKARMDAAEKAYYYLLNHGYIQNDYEKVVGDPDENDSLCQLNQLMQVGLISKPEYSFTKDYDENGATLWDCECSLEDWGSTFGTNYYSKKDAQRHAAYNMLCQLMDLEYDDEYADYDD